MEESSYGCEQPLAAKAKRFEFFILELIEPVVDDHHSVGVHGSGYRKLH